MFLYYISFVLLVAATIFYLYKVNDALNPVPIFITVGNVVVLLIDTPNKKLAIFNLAIVGFAFAQYFLRKYFIWNMEFKFRRPQLKTPPKKPKVVFINEKPQPTLPEKPKTFP